MGSMHRLHIGVLFRLRARSLSLSILTNCGSLYSFSYHISLTQGPLIIRSKKSCDNILGKEKQSFHSRYYISLNSEIFKYEEQPCRVEEIEKLGKN